MLVGNASESAPQVEAHQLSFGLLFFVRIPAQQKQPILKNRSIVNPHFSSYSKTPLDFSELSLVLAMSLFGICFAYQGTAEIF